MFDKRSTSWLSHARSTDVDALQRALDAGMPIEKGKPRSDTFEMGTGEQILAAIYELLQQVIHVAARQKGRPNTRSWPQPVTAWDVVKEQLAKVAYDDLMGDISFVPSEEFQAIVAGADPQETYISDVRIVGDKPEV